MELINGAKEKLRRRERTDPSERVIERERELKEKQRGKDGVNSGVTILTAVKAKHKSYPSEYFGIFGNTQLRTITQYPSMYTL